MPRELITVQIGQCGIQLGSRFWDLALREHAGYLKEPVFDDAMSSFFINVDRQGEEIPLGAGRQRIVRLKARAVLVDMESGVLNEVARGPLGDLFDSQTFVQDVSGSGNNWAHGHCAYGPRYGEDVLESVRVAAECCDSLQSFFLMHSLGGGTGSGLGTYVLSLLEDAYPDVYRFVTAVFPSADDDVVTSPYNSVLSLAELITHADCVLPLDNESLLEVCARIRARGSRRKARGSLLVGEGGHGQNREEEEKKKNGKKPFDEMNTIAAHVLTNLTCSMRFEGELNVDLNEITMNMVPFPRRHFLLPSVSPLDTQADLRPRGVDELFSNAFQPDHQLIKAAPRRSTYLACGIIGRGDLQVSDLNRNVEKLKSTLRMAHWNEDAFKVGLCSVPPVGQPRAILALSNNCCVAETFAHLRARCVRLYKRRAHWHHYGEYIEEARMDAALETVQGVIQDYRDIASAEENDAARDKEESTKKRPQLLC